MIIGHSSRTALYISFYRSRLRDWSNSCLFCHLWHVVGLVKYFSQHHSFAFWWSLVWLLFHCLPIGSWGSSFHHRIGHFLTVCVALGHVCTCTCLLEGHVLQCYVFQCVSVGVHYLLVCRVYMHLLCLYLAKRLHSSSSRFTKP